MTCDAPRPNRRVILLGASNLTMGFSLVVETVRSIWGQPVEIMAAMGHGRSYGQDSTICGRKIPGIFPCSLWQDLLRRPPLPTAALLTDIGNDILYGVSVERLLESISGCLDRLADVDAATIMTQLPLGSLDGLGAARFGLFRALMFPLSKMTLTDVRGSASLLAEQLTALGARRKIPVIPVSNAWYGFDPIHLKRTVWRRAWPEILAGWRRSGAPTLVPHRSIWRWAYLSCLAPVEQTVWGIKRRCDQPSGRLADGTTISLY